MCSRRAPSPASAWIPDQVRDDDFSVSEHSFGAIADGRCMMPNAYAIVAGRGVFMAYLLIRDIPDHVLDYLRRCARQNGRTVEAEVRQILMDRIAREPGLVPPFRKRPRTRIWTKAQPPQILPC
jgi:hypothetical protein